MASFFDEIARNKTKSLIFMFIFTLFFIGILWFFVFAFLGLGWITFAIVSLIVLIYAAYSYYHGEKLVLRVSRAQEADRKQYPNFYAAAEGLSSAMQVPMPKLYVMNDPNPNAFATGRRTSPSICATTGLLSMMNRDELDGVIAHEMSHIADNDVQLMTIAIAYIGAIGLIAAFVRGLMFFGLGGFGGNRRGGGAILVLLLVGFVIGLLAPLFATLMQLAISRRREYLADANGARVTRDPASLVSALKKLQTYSAAPAAKPVQHANEVTAPMYFANPFTGKSVMNLFSTHPPIDERIKRLQAMY